jgi:hypothetical protein
LADNAHISVDDVEAGLARTPFIPFRFHLKDGRTIDVPHPDVAHMLSYGVVVLLGLKEGTHEAEGYDRFPYDAITRIEPRPRKGGSSRRRKAS